MAHARLAGEATGPDQGPPPRLYRVDDAARMLSMGRTAIYELIRSGRLRSVKEGRMRLVPASAIADYIALLEGEVA